MKNVDNVVNNMIKVEKYYKVLNNKMYNDGFYYKEGLNINDKETLTYTTKNFLHKFLEFGCFITEVQIPVDAITHYDSKIELWRTNKLEIIKPVHYYLHNFFNDREFLLNAVRYNGLILMYILSQSKQICKEAIKQNPYAIQYVKYVDNKLAMLAVKQNGLALRYISKQNIHICIDAVKQNGLALEYVIFQTKKICKEAIKQNKLASHFVKIKLTKPQIKNTKVKSKAWRPKLKK